MLCARHGAEHFARSVVLNPLQPTVISISLMMETKLGEVRTPARGHPASARQSKDSVSVATAPEPWSRARCCFHDMTLTPRSRRTAGHRHAWREGEPSSPSPPCSRSPGLTSPRTPRICAGRRALASSRNKTPRKTDCWSKIIGSSHDVLKPRSNQSSGFLKLYGPCRLPFPPPHIYIKCLCY